MPEVIVGIKFKEILCKNDDCRALLGYEKIRRGALAFYCRNCNKWSVFKIHYSKGQEDIDKLVDMVEISKRGGE